MNLKKIILGLFIIGALALTGYLGYKLYHAAIEDATQKIRTAVSEGATEGVNKSVGGALNPLSWPKKIFGR